ncbi:MAG: hypothetical protein H6577_16110 [Lewinellaceae bacterium]|nr:hypothetical protein [Saprospiraceae bacterium]MCB9339653.1 hypothetical protein [Lewinellaceae bacterium]
MESFNWFIGEITGQFAYAAGSIIWNVFLFGFLGFAGGVALVVIGRKREWFRREFRAWSLAAKLNYLYLPLLLMVFGGVTGSFYGVKKTADRFVEKTAAPLAQYAQAYASNIQAYLPDPQWAAEEDMTLEEMIALGLSEKGGLEPGSMASMAATAINLAIAEQMLDEFGVPELVRDPIGAVRAFREASFQASMFSNMTPKLQSVCGQFVWLKYKVVLFFFLPFLLLPLGEYLLHRFFRGARRKAGGLLNKTAHPGPSLAVFLAVSMLVGACGKKDALLNPNEMGEKTSVLSATVDGNSFKSTDGGATFFKTWTGGPPSDSIYGMLILAPQFGNYYAGVGLTLTSVFPPIVGKEYETVGDCNTSPAPEFCLKLGFEVVNSTSGNQNFGSTNKPPQGSCRIKFDQLELKSGGRLKGTFSGTLIGEITGEKLEVTDGEFDTFFQ